jgi:hypothetical protein
MSDVILEYMVAAGIAILFVAFTVLYANAKDKKRDGNWNDV